MSFSMAMESAERSLGSNSKSLLGSLLLGESNGLLIFTLHIIGLLGDMEFNMTVGGQVGGDSTVGSVGSSSTRDSSLDADVSDLALFNIEHLGLSVGLDVLEQVNDVFDRLFRESTIVMVEVLAHSMSAWTSSVSSERNDSLVGKNSLHIGDSLIQHKPTASSGSVVSVLVMTSQIINSALSGSGAGNGLS
jgi:hypothetical protein